MAGHSFENDPRDDRGVNSNNDNVSINNNKWYNKQSSLASN